MQLITQALAARMILADADSATIAMTSRRDASSGIVRYIVGFYKEVSGDYMALARMAGWHLVVYGLPMAAIVGANAVFKMWLAFWLVPQFVVLALLRMIAELEEHDYANPKQTEAGCTFTNIGLIHTWLIHPWNDAYHWVHLALTGVPEHRYWRLHNHLLEHSESYKRSMFRNRILGAPGGSGESSGSRQ